MKRYLGLDLGTTTLGVSITDKANILVVPYKLIKFGFEDYETAKKELLEIIEKEKITDIAIGLPKNMDGSLGFASQRTMRFVELLDLKDVSVNLIDERLTTILTISPLSAPLSQEIGEPDLRWMRPVPMKREKDCNSERREKEGLDQKRHD